MKKKIQHILAGREKQITKEEVILQPLPHQDFRFANPFIVLHHMRPKQIVAGEQVRIQPHPHRGFSPVTFMLQGEGYHKDSIGNNEIIQAGGVQWMFAGKGILHSEGPSEKAAKEGSINELIQLWINVPRKNKFDEPLYQAASLEEQPKVLKQQGVELRLASGDFDGKQGPMQSFTPVVSVVGSIDAGKTAQFTATAGYWTLLYVAKGRACVNQESIGEYNLIVFEQENEEIIVTAEKDATLLYLSAEPIIEPVTARDNFVMNTSEEIDQAIADYKNGVFGTLEF